MKSYGQYCAIAKALDVVGERWTLLLVRELAISGGSRFTDLRRGLPGIAPNLLSERLKELERAGVVGREDAPAPVATTLYVLTERGQALGGVLRELVLWGLADMGPDVGTDTYQPQWFAYAASALLHDRNDGPDSPGQGAPIQVLANDQAYTIRPGRPTTLVSGRTPDAALTMAGPPALLIAVLAGRVDVSTARDRGLKITGDGQLLASCTAAALTPSRAR